MLEIENQKYKRWLSAASKEAQKSTFKYKLGSVIIKNGKIVGRGFNKIKTHPSLFRKYGYFSIHSECDTIMRGSKGDTLVVVRVLKNGKYACSKPCKLCLRFAKKYGIRKIIYVDWNTNIKEMRI